MQTRRKRTKGDILDRFKRTSLVERDEYAARLDAHPQPQSIMGGGQHMLLFHLIFFSCAYCVAARFTETYTGHIHSGTPDRVFKRQFESQLHISREKQLDRQAALAPVEHSFSTASDRNGYRPNERGNYRPPDVSQYGSESGKGAARDTYGYRRRGAYGRGSGASHTGFDNSQYGRDGVNGAGHGFSQLQYGNDQYYEGRRKQVRNGLLPAKKGGRKDRQRGDRRRQVENRGGGTWRKGRKRTKRRKTGKLKMVLNNWGVNGKKQRTRNGRRARLRRLRGQLDELKQEPIFSKKWRDSMRNKYGKRRRSKERARHTGGGRIDKRKNVLPITCGCKISAKRKSVCYDFETGSNTYCKPRLCRPAYVCVPYGNTGMTCNRRKYTTRTVPVGAHQCKSKKIVGYIYVPYNSS